MKAIRRLGTGALLATSMLILPVFKLQASLIDPPSIAEAFSPSSIPLFADSTLTFTITNPATNTSDEVGVAFTDIIPAGISPFHDVASVVCGGTGTVSLQTVNLVGASVAPNSNCVFSVPVSGLMVGSFTNTTGYVTSTNGGLGNFATASIDVVPFNSTPLPTALPLFATGLGALGLLGWRRKRRARASLLGAA